MLDGLSRLLVFLSRSARGLCVNCGEKYKFIHDIRDKNERTYALVYQCGCSKRKSIPI